MDSMPWISTMASTQSPKQIFRSGTVKPGIQKANGLLDHHVDGHIANGVSRPRSGSRTTEAAVQTNVLNGNTEEGVPENIKSIAKELADDIVHHVAQNRNTRPPSKYAKTMRRTVMEISERHNILFGSMVEKLQITVDDAQRTYVSVFDEIFIDGQVNWGRIVAVYAFGARLGEYCAKHGMANIDRIAEFVGDYVAAKLGHWIDETGGWDKFCDFFKEKETLEDKMWRGLVYTAVGLGAGALATFMAGKS